MRFIFLAVILSVFSCIGTAMASLQGFAHASSNGGNHVVAFSGSYVGDPGAIEYVFFRREAVGVCGPREYLYEHQIPVPQGGSVQVYGSFEVAAPNPAVLYVYQPFAMRSDGTEHVIYSGIASDFTSYDLVSCEEAPFLRGTVRVYSGCGGLCFSITPCSSDCWTQAYYHSYPTMDLLGEFSGEDPFGLIGQVVDVYGEIVRGQLIGAPSHDVSRLERTPSGACGPVPTAERNWGSVKAMYR